MFLQRLQMALILQKAKASIITPISKRSLWKQKPQFSQTLRRLAVTYKPHKEKIMSFEKQSINHSSNVAVIEMFARFGFACLVCGQTDLRIITKEHFVAKREFASRDLADFENLWTACIACNQSKATMSADAYFVGKRKSELKQFIIDKLQIEVTPDERNEVIRQYATLIIANAKCGNSPSVVMMRFLVDTNVRKTLGVLDLSNCFIQGNRTDVNAIVKYHDTKNAEIFINATR